MQNKQYFLDFLSGNRTVNVIFEPFIRRTHTETLIWRRSPLLWDTPEHYVDTLVALAPRTRADVVFCDMRIFAGEEKEQLIDAIEHCPGESEIGFGVICDHAEDLEIAETSHAICSAAVYGNAISKRLPTIRMDGTLAEAITRGDAGWYASNNAKEALKTADGRIRILGGLGRELVLRGSPVKIYEEVERLAAEYPGQWACGSGFEIPDDNYLQLISILGAFGRIR